MVDNNLQGRWCNGLNEGKRRKIIVKERINLITDHLKTWNILLKQILRQVWFQTAIFLIGPKKRKNRIWPQVNGFALCKWSLLSLKTNFLWSHPPQTNLASYPHPPHFDLDSNTVQWGIADSNSWPPRCQRGALTNWANTPALQAPIIFPNQLLSQGQIKKTPT